MQKYKVFFNEKRITFVPGANITLSKPSSKLIAKCHENSISDWLQQFETGEQEETVVEHLKAQELFQDFRSSFLQINAAGGVVRRGEELLFIFRNGKWDLPKGKIDKGESCETAALREVEEECGISGHSIIKQLPSTYHIYQSPYKATRGRWVFKETFWYEMDYRGQDDGIPQLDENITKLRWFRPAELDLVLENTYENLKALIRIYRA
ncbi:NUDIX domain-containing protein [uncultured Draconibacterium sp.]|uniref:NUDIX hydrolase n=1 Tax=uncultured Draconibacterium sp. TaxID=1573823 RepID=UPI0032609620